MDIGLDQRTISSTQEDHEPILKWLVLTFIKMRIQILESLGNIALECWLGKQHQ